MTTEQGDARTSGIRSLFTARALCVTALRAALIGGGLVGFMFLDAETRKQPAGEVAFFGAFLFVAVALALGPTTLVEVRASNGPAPGPRALAAAWAVSVACMVLLIVQLVYATALLQTGSFDDAIHVVVDFWAMLRASSEELAALVLFVVLVPTGLSIISGIRLGHVSSGMRMLFTILTFPGGLLALGVYGLVDVLERRLFSPGGRGIVGERPAEPPTPDTGDPSV